MEKLNNEVDNYLEKVNNYFKTWRIKVNRTEFPFIVGSYKATRHRNQ